MEFAPEANRTSRKVNMEENGRGASEEKWKEALEAVKAQLAFQLLPSPM